MKRLISKVATFSVSFFILYCLVIFVLGSIAPQGLKKNIRYNLAGGFLSERLAEVERTKSVDMLVLGSSHAYRGFDPRIFKKMGISVFNLGSGSQTPVQTEYLLDKYLEKVKPKVVLFEVYYVTFGLDGVESACDFFSNTPDYDLGLASMVFQVRSVAGFNTFIYGLMAKTFGSRKANTDFRKLNDEYVSGGFVERKNGVYTEAEKFPKQQIKFNEDQVEAFERIVSKLKQRNIKLVLVQAPITRARYSSFSNIDKFDAYFNKISGGTYYNFNKFLPLQDNYFYDNHHLNQSGVEKFDNLLLSKFKENKELASLFESRLEQEVARNF